MNKWELARRDLLKAWGWGWAAPPARQRVCGPRRHRAEAAAHRHEHQRLRQQYWKPRRGDLMTQTLPDS